MAVKPIPEGYHAITPYLIIKGASKAIDFYRQAFGAQEMVRMPSPQGTIMHAEMKIGDSWIMLADEFPEMGARSPEAYGGTPTFLLLYVPNVDSVVRQAVELGAQLKKPVQDQFYGDRSGTVVDPFGHMWTIATHVEDVAPEEMKRRMAAMPEKK